MQGQGSWDQSPAAQALLGGMAVPSAGTFLHCSHRCGVDGERVDSAGVDTWGVDGAGGALLSEPGWCPTEVCDRQGLLRRGLQWVCSLNPRGSWSVSSS